MYNHREYLHLVVAYSFLCLLYTPLSFNRTLHFQSTISFTIHSTISSLIRNTIKLSKITTYYNCKSRALICCFGQWPYSLRQLNLYGFLHAASRIVNGTVTITLIDRNIRSRILNFYITYGVVIIFGMIIN